MYYEALLSGNAQKIFFKEGLYMFKVTVRVNTQSPRSDLFTPDTTIREVFEHFDVNYNVGSCFMESVVIPAAALDRSLAEMGVVDGCRITILSNKDNA